MSELPKLDSATLDKAASNTARTVKNLVDRGEINTLEELRNRVYDSFLRHFDELIKPEFEAFKYGEYDYRNEEIFNINLFQSENIIETLYEELRDTMDLFVAQEELLIKSSESILEEISEVAFDIDNIENQVERAQFFSKGKAVETISDNFSTLNKIDFSNMEQAANVVTGWGVQLPLAEDLNRSSRVIDIQVEASSVRGEEISKFSEDQLPLRPRPYEGKRFDIPDNTRPEGNYWRIESKNTKVDVKDPEMLRDRIYANMLGPGPDEIWPESESILEENDGGTNTETVKTVTYNITSTAAGFTDVTGATSVTYKGASGDEISGWVEADGTSRQVEEEYDSSGNVISTDVYTATKVETEEEVTTQKTGAYVLRSDMDDKSIITIDERFRDRHPDDVGYIASDLSNVKDSESDEFAKTVTRQDFLYVETAASKDLLLRRQLSMVDSDPGTFWEIEYTPVVAAIEDEILDGVDAAGTDSEKQSAYASAQSIASESAQSLTGDGLNVVLTVKFDNSYTINYFTLDPYLFGDLRESNFIVTNIEVAPDSNLVYKKIPGFDTEFTNEISIESNLSLSNKHFERTGTSNKFGFRGKGVWTLPHGSKVKAMKIHLQQNIAIPNPYPLKNLQLLRVLSKVINESRSVSTGTVTKDSTENTTASGGSSYTENGRMTQWLQFGYLETIVDSLTSGTSTSLLAGKTAAASASSNVSSGTEGGKLTSTHGQYEAYGGAIGSVLGGAAATAIGTGFTGTGSTALGGSLFAAAAGVLGSVVGSKFDKHNGSSSGSTSDVSRTFSDSGYYINREWYKTVWSRVRYAIGIRELSFNARNFEPSGEILSTPYEIRKGNKEITLEVSKSVPNEFLSFNSNKSYIEYYIDVDGTRHRIQPIIGEKLQNQGSIPSSFNLNDLAEEDTAEVRFYARIMRPASGSLLNSEALTPVLHSYKINIIEL